MPLNPDTAREIKAPWSAPSPFHREPGDFSPHPLPFDVVPDKVMPDPKVLPVSAEESLVPELDIAVNPADDSDLFPPENEGAYTLELN